MAHDLELKPDLGHKQSREQKDRPRFRSTPPSLAGAGVRQARRHLAMHRLQGLRGRVQGVERAEDIEPTTNFGSFQSHEDLSPDTWLLMRFNEVEVGGALTGSSRRTPVCTARSRLPLRLPVARRHRPVHERHRRLQSGAVHRLQLLRVGLSLRHPALRARQARHVQVQHVRRPGRVGSRAGVRRRPVPPNAINWGSKEDMVAMAEKKVEGLERRGYEHAMLYDPPGVGGTHMMYVVPHGDRLRGVRPAGRPGRPARGLAGTLVRRSASGVALPHRHPDDDPALPASVRRGRSTLTPGRTDSATVDSRRGANVR